MDYTEINQLIKKFANAQGIDSSYLDRKETLYYDESGNVKQLIVKGDSLNADIDSVFVLGGIQAENDISSQDLKTALGKQPASELKAKDDLRGTFKDILRKDNFRKVLELIRDRNWNIHFDAVHVLYYGFVDIVDSIEGLNANPAEFKAVLYEVLRKDPQRTIDHFKNYKYPNVKSRDKDAFLDGIIVMMKEREEELAAKCIASPGLLWLMTAFEDAKTQDDLPFIQEEETHVWVKPFIQFYRQEILQFPNKVLRFDEEKQVQRALGEETIEIDGKEVANYIFIDSKTNAMIQICDYVSSIIRKYIMFLDRTQPEVETDLKNLDADQLANYKLMNFVLKRSLEYNPMFVHFTVSEHTRKKYFKYMYEYGE